MRATVAFGVLGTMLLFSLLSCTDISASIQAQPPNVFLGDTRVVGAEEIAAPGVVAFKGIPYAQAPTGQRRWRPPVPLVLAQDEMDATAFAPACMQSDYNARWYADVAAAFGVEQVPVQTPTVSEDCLYLNIWSPDLQPEQPLPVMVWIHGGSNKAGWAYEPNYLGMHLAKAENLVVVSINYRLGVFGFFDLPGRSADDADTNFALLDQIAALNWVQQHIAAFGGDPASVTLFGESAGAANIGYLMASPKAKGLFQRAISQSGAFQLLDLREKQDLTEMGQQLQAALSPETDGIDGLRKLPAQQLLDFQESQLKDFSFRARAGSAEMPVNNGDFFRTGKVVVDLLIGSNADEWYMYLSDDEVVLAKMLDALPGQLQAQAKARINGLDNVRAQDVLSTLQEMRCPGYFMAAQVAASGMQAWVYQFDRVRAGEGGRALGAYHGAEIPYVFNSHDAWLSTAAADHQLTQRMMRYWANFARTGNPNDESLPEWPAYTAKQPRILHLDNDSTAATAPDIEFCTTLQAELPY